MPHPGTTLALLDTPATRSALTAPNVWFVAGFTEKGPIESTLCKSMGDYTTKFGGYTAAGANLYNAVEAFFKRGGKRLRVSRVTGPTPVKASLTLSDGAAGGFKAEALYYGAYGNNLKLQVVNPASGGAGTYEIVVQDAANANAELERSGSLVDKTAGLAWAANSGYIRLTDLGGTADPVAMAATVLANGADDNANATDATWKTANDRHLRDYGPGMVSFPGRTTATAHADLTASTFGMRRVAILDAADTTTKSTLLTAAAAARLLPNARFAGMFMRWRTVPPLTVGGINRRVPPSAFVAGGAAYNDDRGVSSNQAPSGDFGIEDYALSLENTGIWTDTDLDDFTAAGLNYAIEKYGGVRNYGFRSLVDPTGPLKQWKFLGNARLFTAIGAKADEIAEHYVGRMIDGGKIVINQFGGDLIGMLLPMFLNGSLYGTTPEEAFFVDVGDNVNTDATIDAGELRANITVRMAGMAEQVLITVVKTPVSERIAA